ncbi:hypothetical protein FHX90_004360, partial [Clostridium saccharobutylicum]|nr:hypothetical protein [Clostridium saccharobutylicum]NSB70253.1 hypothetical protein [Clostridium saccharobutylicum]NYD00616.1 hypothetical protein [Clostridium saccharobutylicum]
YDYGVLYKAVVAIGKTEHVEIVIISIWVCLSVF